MSIPTRREVTLAGEPVALATREFDLLHYLAEHRGLALSRLNCSTAFGVWVGRRRQTVDFHVASFAEARRRLRLETVWAWGTALTERAAREAPTTPQPSGWSSPPLLLAGAAPPCSAVPGRRRSRSAGGRIAERTARRAHDRAHAARPAGTSGLDSKPSPTPSASTASASWCSAPDPIGSLPEGLTVEDLDTDLLRAGETQSNRDGDLLWAAARAAGTAPNSRRDRRTNPVLMPSFHWFLLASLATIVVAALVAGARQPVAHRTHPGIVMSPTSPPVTSTPGSPTRTAAGRDEVGELVASINSMAATSTIERT